MTNKKNYSGDKSSQENTDPLSKYSNTGESEFTRSSTVPIDQDEVLTERHYSFGSLEAYGKRKLRYREPRSAPPPTQDFRGRGPKNFTLSDEKIKDEVCEALYRNSHVDASKIEVFVSNGVVTLKGVVANRNQKRWAEGAIDHLAGVVDVFNELQLEPSFKDLKKSKHGLIDNITGLN